MLQYIIKSEVVITVVGLSYLCRDTFFKEIVHHIAGDALCIVNCSVQKHKFDQKSSTHYDFTPIASTLLVLEL